MKQTLARWLAPLYLTMLALSWHWGGTVAAQTQAPATPAQEAPPLEPAAMDTLKRMGDLLKSAKSFTFTYQSTHEQVAQTGQMVNFIHRSRVTIVRPNKLRLEVTGDVRNSILTYDGRMVTFLDPTQKFYSQLDAPGSIDDALTLLMDKFQTSFPVAGVMFADPFEKMKDGLKTAVDLGVARVDGVDCRHLLFGEEDADWQVWVQAGKQPLPRLLSIVYKNAPGAPRVLAAFSDWKINPAVPGARFSFVKPAGATKVELKTATPGN